MNANKNVTATFHKLQYTLTGTITGTGSGTVNVNPPNVNYTSSFTRTYNSGTSVTLTATPAAGSYFAGWSGDCSGTGTCAVTMNSNKSVTATFTLVTYTLSVVKTGTGSGTVTSSPAGINCGSTCSAGYTSGTSVTLTASPSSGSYFAGWSGDCSGTGTCAVTMNANKNVTATFNLSDAVPPTTGIKIIRTATGEDVTTAGYWLRADNYTIQFEDKDQADGSGSNCESCSCEYSIFACDVNGVNCGGTPEKIIVDTTDRTCGSWSFDITAGKTAPNYWREGAGRYLIYSGAKDMANNPSATEYRYINFDFTPPETRIE